MKVSLNAKIKDLDGKPFQQLDLTNHIGRILLADAKKAEKAHAILALLDNQDIPEDITFRSVAIRCLLAPEQSLSGKEKQIRACLAIKIKAAKATIVLDTAMVKKLREVIGKHEQSTLIAGRCLQLLED